MKNFHIKVLFFLLLSINYVNSAIIKDVEVEGNQRISKETIIVLAGIKLNEKYDLDDLNNSLKKLYDTNFFSDIDISQTNGILKITVNENPIIEEIEILLFEICFSSLSNAEMPELGLQSLPSVNP